MLINGDVWLDLTWNRIEELREEAARSRLARQVASERQAPAEPPVGLRWRR